MAMKLNLRTFKVCRFLVTVAAASLTPIANAQQLEVELVERAQPISNSFGPTSEVLITGSKGYLQLWNWLEKKFVGPRILVNRKYERDPSSGLGIGRLRFSKDGRFMAACRDRKDTDERLGSLMLAQVWDLRSGATVAELERTTTLEQCRALDFSPDGRTLALATKNSRGSSIVRFYTTQDWTEIRHTDFGPDVLVHDQLNYSPNGDQIVVWASDGKIPPGMTAREHAEANLRIGTNFLDHKIEAIIINAADGIIITRKVLHWTPKHHDRTDSTNGFDATGERVLSSVPFGGVIEDYEAAVYNNCPSFQPVSVPEGFDRTDLCRKHKALQVWHWRTGKVETLFEYPMYVRSRLITREHNEIWTSITDAQFTSDGCCLVLNKRRVEKIDFDPNSVIGARAAYTLEIWDASQYQLKLTQNLLGKSDTLSSPLQISSDGRFLTYSTSQHRKLMRSGYHHYLHEIVQK